VLVSRSDADLETARKHIEGQYKVSVRADNLADSANVTRLANQFPDVDILVNNAGAIPGGTLFDVDEARWRTAWDLKVFGTINITRAFYPLMKARGGGAVINVIGNAERTELFKSLPGERVGEPAEIAAMVAFLASPKSNYTSGVVITLDAGVSSRAGLV
jgi:NAD(P)-dependent dehydrogenase (short-subunit alcohol dehydrogenase family)